MYGYVYLTTNLINNKKYIGMHISSEFDPGYKGSGTILWQAIRKYGWENFKVELLEECNTREDLGKCEARFIEEYNAIDSKEFYNLKEGGFGGYKINGVSIKKGVTISEQARINTSLAHRGKPWTDAQRKSREGMFVGKNNPFYGKDFSPETKVLLSQIRRGRIWINNGEIDTTIRPEEFEKYASKGYVKGRLKGTSQMREACANKSWNWITKDLVNKKVSDEELESYLKDGWIKGRYIPPRRATTIENTTDEKDIG